MIEWIIERCSKLFQSRMSDKQIDALCKIDPNRITVDDVQAVLNVPRWVALQILKTAVRRGEFGEYLYQGTFFLDHK